MLYMRFKKNKIPEYALFREHKILLKWGVSILDNAIVRSYRKEEESKVKHWFSSLNISVYFSN